MRGMKVGWRKKKRRLQRWLWKGKTYYENISSFAISTVPHFITSNPCSSSIHHTHLRQPLAPLTLIFYFRGHYHSSFHFHQPACSASTNTLIHCPFQWAPQFTSLTCSHWPLPPFASLTRSRRLSPPLASVSHSRWLSPPLASLTRSRRPSLPVGTTTHPLTTPLWVLHFEGDSSTRALLQQPLLPEVTFNPLIR